METTIKGRSPWFSLDADTKPKHIRKQDPQEQIDYCMNHCPFPECVDCLGNSSGRKRKFTDEQLRDALKLRKTTKETCAILGCSQSQYFYWKARMENRNV